jgi:FG-GAP-like repeat
VNKLIAFMALAVVPTDVGADDRHPKFSDKPIWVSGSNSCGGDGNARLLDVDQDGDLDLVTSAPNPSRWVVFENAAGKLAEKPMWESKPTTDCDHISVVDFNKDGLPDLAGTHESHNTLYLNDKSRKQRFDAVPDWETTFYTDSNQIDFGDVDGDGDFDMLIASGLPTFQLALCENKDGELSRTITTRIGPRKYSESSIFGDVDKDGDLDIIATYSEEGSIVLFKNNGSGKFDNGNEIYKDTKVSHVQRVYCIDVNNDGKMELFCAKGPWGPPGRSIALTYDNGAVRQVWESAADTGFHGFDFADVDADGDLDMVAADWSGRSVSVFLRENGMIATKPSWSASTPAPVHEAVFGDLDRDGDLDVVAGGLDQAMLFENLTK